MGNLPTVTVVTKEQRRGSATTAATTANMGTNQPHQPEDDEPPPSRAGAHSTITTSPSSSAPHARSPSRAMQVPSGHGGAPYRPVSTAPTSSPPSSLGAAPRIRRRRRGPSCKYSWAVEATRSSKTVSAGPTPVSVALRPTSQRLVVAASASTRTVRPAVTA